MLTDDTLVLNNNQLSLALYHESLHLWAKDNLRVFPWRKTDNPFHILIAEMMLRRTQAKQVVPVYEQFVARYPDPDSLAIAPAEDVAMVLYPLGLSWRVPAFQHIARELVQMYHGAVPDQYKVLLRLPGVGDYVASAVCSFAFKQAVPVIDTNTVRVAGRLFGIPTHAESRRRQPIRSILIRLLDQQNPGAYNYTLLDFASLICKPDKPCCEICPLKDQCLTGRSQQLRK